MRYFDNLDFGISEEQKKFVSELVSSGYLEQEYYRLHCPPQFRDFILSDLQLVMLSTSFPWNQDWKGWIVSVLRNLSCDYRTDSLRWVSLGEDDDIV